MQDAYKEQVQHISSRWACLTAPDEKRIIRITRTAKQRHKR